MNIEEAIEKLKRQITVGKCEKNIGIPVYISDLETLITAYEEKGEECDFLDKELYNANQEIQKLQINIQKEKEKNKELTERVLKLESDKFWDNVVSKSKIKQIIYPTPENPIPLEIQQSEMYKKLLKEVEK